MKSRLEKLKRIERLQKQLHDLSRWKLTHLAEQREKLATTHVEMIKALGEGLLSFGGAASAATRRIRSLELEMSATEAEHAAQAKQTFAQGARSKMAEHVVERAEAVYQREAEKRTLNELIEQSVQRSHTGPHKP